MAYNALVVEVKNSMLFDHPNADKLQLLRTNGYTIVVGLDVKEGDVGLLFGTDTPGKIEPWFLQENDLYARRDDEGKNVSRGFFEPSGRVKSVNIRGIKSEGFFHVIRNSDGYKLLPGDVTNTYGLVSGDVIGTLNGQKLCSKYYVKSKRGGFTPGGNRSRSAAQATLTPNLAKHYDTEQLRHRIGMIPKGAILRMTLKLHGTSGRTGNVRAPETWLQRMLKRIGLSYHHYAYQSGTRNMVLRDEHSGYTSFKDEFAQERLHWHDVILEQGLPKGVTLYYEIVGYGVNGNPIMSPHYLDGGTVEQCKVKVVNKDSVPTGETVEAPRPSEEARRVVYHYGCSKGTSDLYVYRITQTSDDGHVVDYSYEQVVSFCQKRNLKVVPNIGGHVAGLVWDGDVERLVRWLEDFCEEPDPIGGHVMEGVVIKVEHPDWYGPPALKYKGKTFVTLEGYAYDNGLVDTEEEA